MTQNRIHIEVQWQTAMQATTILCYSESAGRKCLTNANEWNEMRFVEQRQIPRNRLNETKNAVFLVVVTDSACMCVHCTVYVHTNRKQKFENKALHLKQFKWNTILLSHKMKTTNELLLDSFDSLIDFSQNCMLEITKTTV